MKKFKVLYLVTTIFMNIVIPGCSYAQQTPIGNDTNRGSTLPAKNILIVYLSRTNNTRAVVGSGFTTVKELCPESKVLDGFTIKGGIERDGILFVMNGKKEEQASVEIKQWLEKLGLK